MKKSLIFIPLGLVVAGCGTSGQAPQTTVTTEGSHAQHLAAQKVDAHRNAAGKLECPVMKSEIPSEAKAAGHSDHGGKRYYFCCAGCKPEFDKDPAKYAMAGQHDHHAGHGTPVTGEEEVTTVKVGKYVVELWPPEEGLVAGQEIDVEFGVFDSTKKEADGGLAGIADVKVSAVVSMPSMPGMPNQRPHVHKEGRAGVYGLELFFPHGGPYQIALTLTPKGAAPIKANFTVNVKDEDSRPAAGKAKPYSLVLDVPKTAVAGKPFELRMAVRDNKTKKVVRDFDIAHEKRFHLIVVSKDLGYFIHEHPEQNPDGTWSIKWNFPAGGDYVVFGDVAPTGRGSQVLGAPLRLKGPKAKWNTALRPTGNRSKDAGIVARFEPRQNPIPVGKMAQFAFHLTDEKTGKPLRDLQPYLGAFGHLMVIHQDGTTFVHSHPMEDAEGMRLSKSGTVVFNGRLPKAGTYKAWGQFQRAGKVATIPFVFHVK